MIIVGICGGSGSGKSTFAERIRDGLSCSCEIMRLDCYYFDQGGKPFEERTKVTTILPKYLILMKCLRIFACCLTENP